MINIKVMGVNHGPGANSNLLADQGQQRKNTKQGSRASPGPKSMKEAAQILKVSNPTQMRANENGDIMEIEHQERQKLQTDSMQGNSETNKTPVDSYMEVSKSPDPPSLVSHD